MKRYILVAISLFLSGCYEPAPPKGFEAVVPHTARPEESACPNLVDTYLISSLKGSTALFDEAMASENFSYFAIDSVTPNPGYRFTLKMSRDRFIRTAQTLKSFSPKNYALWRENFLLLNQNYSESQLATVLKYGPAFSREGRLRRYSCSKGWAKVKEIFAQGQNPKTNQMDVRQTDVWLARDKYGDLLIHTVTYRQEKGWTFWAAGGAGTKLVRLYDQWDKMLKTPDSMWIDDWKETDLPITKPIIGNLSQCSPNKIVDFNNRLIQSGALIQDFSAQPVSLKDGACFHPPIQFSFSAANSAEGKKVMQFVESDPIVGSVELVETRYANGRLVYRLEVRTKDDGSTL